MVTKTPEHEPAKHEPAKHEPEKHEPAKHEPEKAVTESPDQPPKQYPTVRDEQLARSEEYEAERAAKSAAAEKAAHKDK
jgi:hypothetical protein